MQILRVFFQNFFSLRVTEPSPKHSVSSFLRAEDALVGLTEREEEVLKKLVESELGVQEIAEELFISRRTLQRHISSIYQKFSVNNRIGLIKKIYQKAE